MRSCLGVGAGTHSCTNKYTHVRIQKYLNMCMCMHTGYRVFSLAYTLRPYNVHEPLQRFPFYQPVSLTDHTADVVHTPTVRLIALSSRKKKLDMSRFRGPLKMLAIMNKVGEICLCACIFVCMYRYVRMYMYYLCLFVRMDMCAITQAFFSVRISMKIVCWSLNVPAK